MITDAGTKNVQLSQFPHSFDEPTSSHGPNTTLSWAETVTTEGSNPDKVFRIHLPDDDGFAKAVEDQKSRKYWDWKPDSKKSETHCARAAYDALKAGGLPIDPSADQKSGQLLPGTLGDLLGDLAKSPKPGGANWTIEQLSTDYNKIINTKPSKR